MYEVEFTATSILIAFCIFCVLSVALYCSVAVVWSLTEAAMRAMGV